MAAVASENDGLLRPSDVVAYAADPDTALHSYFTWDDSVAAHSYRVWQARKLIAVNVTVLSSGTSPVRVYVSLAGDRHSGGGYRGIVSVLADSEQSDDLLGEALREMRHFTKKYRTLKALAPVIQEMNKVQRRRLGRKRRSVAA